MMGDHDIAKYSKWDEWPSGWKKLILEIYKSVYIRQNWKVCLKENYKLF